jgi:CheY-like chemotaxis protein
MVPFRVEREVTVRSVLVCVRTELAEQAVSNAAAQLGLSDIITTAVSGADALARVAEQPADVLLVDTASVRPDTVAVHPAVLERSAGAAGRWCFSEP